MPLKLNVGLSKKIGQPDYGSLGACCNIEFEVDAGLLDHDLDEFQQRVRNAYVACNQAINDELVRHREQSPAQPSGTQQTGHDHNRANNGNHSAGSGGNGNGREITAKQLAYARQLAGQIDAIGARRLDPLANRLYGKATTDLSSFEGSQLIDMLKETKAGRVTLPADLDGVAS
jgi:hypothetical protein